MFNIYIDFSKAFDRLSHRKLIFVLYHYKIINQIINWIQDLLTHRSQKTIVEGKSSQPCSITSGVPQDSVLGPLLFVLYLESLIIDIKENCTNSKIYAFADDVKLLSTDAQELQKALNIIHTWALKWNLLIQPKKSEHINFSFTSSSSDHLNTFFMNQTEIPCSESVNDLGLLLSRNLKWSEYISKITSKANQISYTILRAFESTNYNLHLSLFKTFVRPILEYNTAIWSPNFISKEDTKTVEKVQRQFTKRLCQKNNIKFQDYDERLHILNLETLETRRIKFDITLMFKIKNNLIDIDFDKFFKNKLSTNYNLRGHDQQLDIPKYSGSKYHDNFFSNRILNIWNNLPQDLVNSRNLYTFKTNLNKLNIHNILPKKS